MPPPRGATASYDAAADRYTLQACAQGAGDPSRDPEDDEEAAGQRPALRGDARQVGAHAQVPVDEAFDNQCVHHGQRCRFHQRRESTQDACQHDDGKQ